MDAAACVKAAYRGRTDGQTDKAGEPFWRLVVGQFLGRAIDYRGAWSMQGHMAAVIRLVA